MRLQKFLKSQTFLTVKDSCIFYLQRGIPLLSEKTKEKPTDFTEHMENFVLKDF